MEKYGDKKWYGPIGRCLLAEAALDGKPEPGASIGSFPTKNLHTLPDNPHHLKSSDYSPEMFLNRSRSISFITADSFQAMFSVCISGGENRLQNRIFCDSVMSFVAADKAAYPFRHKQLRPLFTTIHDNGLSDKISSSITTCLVNVVPETFITYIHFTQSTENFIGTYIVVVGYKLL